MTPRLTVYNFVVKVNYENKNAGTEMFWWDSVFLKAGEAGYL